MIKGPNGRPDAGLRSLNHCMSRILYDLEGLRRIVILTARLILS
jgi:hypothetical protein